MMRRTGIQSSVSQSALGVAYSLFSISIILRRMLKPAIYNSFDKTLESNNLKIAPINVVKVRFSYGFSVLLPNIFDIFSFIYVTHVTNSENSASFIIFISLLFASCMIL